MEKKQTYPEETIRLKAEKTGRLLIVDDYDGTGKKITKYLFTTPNSDGIQFNRLFQDLREGDEIEITFKNVRICSHCGKVK